MSRFARKVRRNQALKVKIRDHTGSAPSGRPYVVTRAEGKHNHKAIIHNGGALKGGGPVSGSGAMGQ